MRPLLALTLTLAALPACGSDEPLDPPDSGPAPRATWYQDVAPLVSQHCMGCHREGGIAPFSLTDYAAAKAVGPVALAAVESGLMPPWDAVASDDCAPRFDWKHDPRLSPAELDTFRAWVEDGMAEGTPADIPDPPDTALTGITHSVTPATPYATAGDVDEFICFVLDPGVTQLGWMTGLQLTPGNPEVVHHAVTSVMPPGAELDALKQQHPIGEPFACNGGGTFPGAYLLNVWTPGQEPMQTAPEVAIPVQPGAALVVQFHYHPGGVANEPDDTRIDLRLSSTVPRMMYTIGAWGNAFAAPELLAGPDDPAEGPAFYIPREVAGHREHMRFQVVTDSAERFPLLFAYPHMHYIGVELAVKIERATPRAGEPASECLVNVDRWDFDWQRTYQYDAAIDELPTVGNGDVIDVDCSYDNTIDNPFVQRALEELGLSRPIDVFLGEESLDEMCLGIFGIAFEVGSAAKTTVPTPPDLRLVPVAR